MYIVAIAWLYVTLLMATAETSWVAGVMTFVFYGVAPLALLLWLFGIPRRARDRRRAVPLSVEAAAAAVPEGIAPQPPASDKSATDSRETAAR